MYTTASRHTFISITKATSQWSLLSSRSARVYTVMIIIIINNYGIGIHLCIRDHADMHDLIMASPCWYTIHTSFFVYMHDQ